MVSKEFQVTSANFYKTEDLIEDAVLDDADPIYDLKRLAGTSFIPVSKLQEYTGNNSANIEGSNVSKTAMEKVIYQQKNNIQPGSPEWFRLWFSLPLMTGEKPW